ncbi:MAG: GIY-YIG nuclease family protein [Polaromonas sp.]
MANKRTTSQSQSLVINRIENVSKDVFQEYYEQITELVGDSPGIYALYDEKDLYYVGKSIDLKKRVKTHLKDRHLASWTHFSLYLVREADHIAEIESLLIRIANPKGNRIIPKGRSTGVLAKQLRSLIVAKQKLVLAGLFAPKRASQKMDRRHSTGRPATLEGMVSKTAKLYRTYKGQEYLATLNPKGVITFKGQKYASPTGAAKALVGPRAVNGWRFWYIQNAAGDWVTLADYKS